MFTSAWLIFCISETNVFILRNSVIPWTVNDAYKVFLDLTKMSSKETTTSSVLILTVASWRPLCDSQWPVWAGSQWFFMPWIWQSSSESTKPGRQSLISMHVLTMLYYSTITIVHLSFLHVEVFRYLWELCWWTVRIIFIWISLWELGNWSHLVD